MKLSEIYTLKPTNPRDTTLDFEINQMTPQLKQRVAQARSEPSHSRVGTGANAYVYKHNTPTDMDYVIRLSDTRDSAARYLKALKERPDLRKNPYLPRVLKITQLDNATVSIKVERLVPFDTPELVQNELMLRSILERITSEDVSHTTPASLSYEIVDIIERGIFYGPNIAHITDNELADAVKFIRMIKDTTKSKADIHIGNIMWRMTGSMPQIVITDPLNVWYNMDGGI